MLRVAAFVCFILGFVLELVQHPLGVFTPLAAGLLGLAFLALAYFDLGTVIRRRR